MEPIQNPTTASLNVRTIVERAEKEIPLDEEAVHALADTELEELSAAFEQSHIIKGPEKQRAAVIITNQRERLKLQQQLPQIPSVISGKPKEGSMMNQESITPKDVASDISTKQTAVPEKSLTVADQVHRFSTGITETVLGKERTKDWTDERKQAVGLAISLGTAAVVGVGLWMWLRGKRAVKAGEEAGKEAKGGLLKKLLIAAGIGLVAFMGIKTLQGKLTMDQVEQKIKDKLEEGKNAAEEIAKPWIKYGLEKAQYEEATSLYKTQREGGTEEIAKIFNVKTGQKNEKYEKFLEDMREKYETNSIEGIQYARVDVSLKHYEESMEVAMSTLLEWLKNHWAEAAIATYFIGLRNILEGGASVAQKSAECVKAVGTFGVKSLTKHPLISLLALGSSVLALHTVKENIYLPENLDELSKATQGKKLIVRGNIEKIPRQTIMAIQQNAENIGEIGSNYQAWVAEKTNNLMATIITEIPKAISLTNQETITNRTTDGMDALAINLTNSLVLEQQSDEKIKEQLPEKTKNALEKLKIFRASYLQHRCTAPSTSDEPQETFEELKKALEAIGITVERKNSIVFWKTPEMQEAYGLCVDPSIKDTEAIHKISEDLIQGDSILTQSFTRSLEYLRETQQEALDKGEKLPWMGQSGIMAMAAGNMMYFFEFDATQGFIDWENMGNYWLAPLDVTKNLFDTDKTWANAGTASVKGMVAAAYFTATAAPLVLIKRLAVGGGKLTPHIGKHIKHLSKTGQVFEWVQNLFPGKSQALSLFNGYRGIKDIGVSLKLGWADGHFVNTVCAKAGLRPEWILAMENATDIKQLHNIAGTMGIYKTESLNGGAPTIDDVKDAIRKIIKERFDEIRIKEMNVKNWGKRLFTPGQIASGDDAYEKVLHLNKKPAVTPKPTTTKSAVSRGGAALKAVGATVTAGMAAYEIADYLQERPRLLRERALEKDSLKRDMITNKLRSKEASIGINTIGGGLMLTGIGTIPATVAVLGNAGREFLESGIDEGLDYTLLREKDFATYDQATILETIDRSSEGYISYSQAASAAIGSVGESVKTSNTFVRGEAYRAYFAQQADTLPALEEEYLSETERKEDTTSRQFVLQAINADQKTKFAHAAEDYIRQITKGDYRAVTPEMLRKAEVYARMVIGEWRIYMLTGQERQLENMSWDDTAAAGKSTSGRLHLVDIEERHVANVISESLTQLKKEKPKGFKKDAEIILLMEITHELANVEKNIRSADLDGLAITGAEDTSKNLARMTAAYLVQAELQKNVEWLEKKSSINAGDIETVLRSLRDTLSREPDQYVNAGKEYQWKAFGDPSQQKNIESLLTIPGIVSFIKERTTSPESQTSQTAKQIENDRGRINGMRLSKGEAMLKEVQANSEAYLGGDAGYVWKISFGFFDKPLYACYDADISKWKISTGSWIASDAGQRNTALAGIPAEDFAFGGGRWGTDEKYRFVIQELATINNRTQ